MDDLGSLLALDLGRAGRGVLQGKTDAATVGKLRSTSHGAEIGKAAQRTREVMSVWTNPWGAEQFGASFFMITGFHGLHVSVGVIMLLIVATKVLRGHFDRGGDYSAVEIAGLYWHFVDLVWVFIFALFYLW